jgi:asparaginyl-tRNA synthetase
VSVVKDNATGPRTAAEVLRSKTGELAEVKGWVANKSRLGGVVFAIIRDGSGYVQVSAKKGATPEAAFSSITEVTKESAVVAGGEVREDKRAPGGKEISVSAFTILSKADTWPITRTAVKSASFLSDMRHLSIRGRKAIAAMKIRSEVIGAAFDFFRENDFVLISAPSFVQAAVEGGSTLFEVSYFGKKAYLSQSAQFYEEAAIPALKKVWILQPAYRAEKSKTAKHLTEFWMIEAEQAFADQGVNMRLMENLLFFMVKRVLERRQEELRIIGRKLREFSLPIPRVTYDEVRKQAVKKGVGFEWGEDIPTEAEKLASESQTSPFFITDYPLSARSFYHLTYEDRPKVTRSADLIAPEGFGELATGGQRIADYNQLMERIRNQDLAPESFSWYLELRKYGMPPHSGFGLGVERTTRWVAGLRHIRSASLFPRTITRISP